MLSVLIDTHLLQAAHAAGADRFFYSSTACVYNTDMQGGDSIGFSRPDNIGQKTGTKCRLKRLRA